MSKNGVDIVRIVSTDRHIAAKKNSYLIVLATEQKLTSTVFWSSPYVPAAVNMLRIITRANSC